jgi:hypothetical protein
MTAQPDTAVLVLEAFAPDTLLLDISRRADVEATVTAEFTAQLAAHAKTAPPVPVHGAGGETARCGNHTPVLIVTRDDGSLAVLLGNRRTVGCHRAGVPVLGYIAGPEGTTKAVMADQLTAQITENRQRQGYTLDEETTALATLFDLGVTPAQIVKRTGLSRPEVDAVKVVAASEFARRAGERYDLDLLQRATLAEFDEANDAQGAAAAIAAAHDNPGQFDHVVQQLRDSRTARIQKGLLVAELEAAGYQVTDRAYSTGWWHVANLLDGDGKEITPESHASCPGRAVSITATWGWRDDAAEAAYRASRDLEPDDEYEFGSNAEAEAAGFAQTWEADGHYCTDAAANGHTMRSGRAAGRDAKPEPGSAEALAATEKRRALLRNNRDWRSANDVRAAFVTALLTRKKLGRPLEDAAALFRAEAITRNETEPSTMGEGHTLACTLLGVNGDGTGYGGRDAILAVIAKASPERRRVIELGMCLAADEHGARDEHTWQQAEAAASRYYRPTRTARYLAFLRDHCGYGLSPLEAMVAALADPAPEPDAGRDADRGEETVHLPLELDDLPDSDQNLIISGAIGPPAALPSGRVINREDWIRLGGAVADDDECGGLQPGDPIPPERTGGMEGFVVGECGHRVARSEWDAGFRTCERCPATEAAGSDGGDGAGGEPDGGDGPWPGDEGYEPASVNYAGDDQ